MVDHTYNPRSDQKADFEGNTISTFATHEVQIPYREKLLWPKRCVLCDAPATKTSSISTNFKSANYVVAKKTSTLTFDGIPYCKRCHKRSTFTPIQIVFIILGPVLGFIAAGLFGTFVDGSICMGCSIWIIISILFILFATFIIGGGMGAPPVQMEVKTEGNEFGKDRPVQMNLKFRNRRISEDFRELNMPKQERHDLW